MLVAGLLIVAGCSSDDTAGSTVVTTGVTVATTPATPQTTSPPTTPPQTTSPPSTTPPQTSAPESPATTEPDEAATTVALVVGDFGVGTPSEYQVAAAMRRAAEERSASVLITTGDNFYSEDAEAIWLEPFGWVDELGLTVYASWGNHDIETPAREALVTDLLAPPGHWYEARVGQANLVVLDANRPGDGGQKAWMTNQLQRYALQQTIVVFHQPAHSCSQHGSTEDVIESWQYQFERSGVDIVLSGHDHTYQRIFQGNVTYLVTGGGGADLYEVGDCPPGTSEPVVFNDTDHHFAVLEISKGLIAVEVLAADGSSIDEFTVANRAPRSSRPEGVR